MHISSRSLATLLPIYSPTCNPERVPAVITLTAEPIVLHPSIRPRRPRDSGTQGLRNRRWGEMWACIRKAQLPK